MSEICKLKENEDILKGDLVAIDQISGTAHKATLFDKKKVVGVCADIYPDTNEILICNEGIIDVNVTGIICLGDHLAVSNKAGKAEAINYEIMEEKQFDVRSIGKVITLGDVYSKATVLLNIK